MPRRKSSIKAKRADDKKRSSNLQIKKNLKETIKKYKKTVQAKDTAEASTQLKKVFSQLDKAAKKNVIHKNTASRKKSRFTQSLSRTAKAN